MNWVPQAFRTLGPKAVGTPCSGSQHNVYEYRSSIELGPMSFTQTTPRQFADHGIVFYGNGTQTLTFTIPRMRLYAATVPDLDGWSPGTNRWLYRLFHGNARTSQTDKFNQIGSYLYAVPTGQGCYGVQASFTVSGSDGQLLKCSGELATGGGTFLEAEQSYIPGWPTAVLGYRSVVNDEFEFRRVLPVVRLCGALPSLVDGSTVLIDILLHRGLNWAGHSGEPYLDENSVDVPMTFTGVTWKVQHYVYNSIGATNYDKINYPLYHAPFLYQLPGSASWDWTMTIRDPCPPPARPSNQELIENKNLTNPMLRCQTCGG
ncbi:MAG: hypothetical protein KDB60_11275 [Propionibacteriaceae bacterium]|nr:hypothetical protein [Propionibacteriaceae bacterium]